MVVQQVVVCLKEPVIFVSQINWIEFTCCLIIIQLNMVDLFKLISLCAFFASVLST